MTQNFRDIFLKFKAVLKGQRATSDVLKASIDETPWKHPFLSHDNLRSFVGYSKDVWEWAKALAAGDCQFSCVFAVNMAQNMYKWAQLSQKLGVKGFLLPNPMDKSALSDPRWEEFDGEWVDLLDGEGFDRFVGDVELKVPLLQSQMEGDDLFQAYAWSRYRTEHKALFKLAHRYPRMKLESFFCYEGAFPYFNMAKQLYEFDISYAAGNPIASYFSGKPYCTTSVGGDLQYECGLPNDHGLLLSRSFAASRFLTVSNPHVLGHCRRHGFVNGIYLPYPIDDSKYSPGIGRYRREWERLYGKGIYILVTSRLDSSVKGFGIEVFNMLEEVLKARPDIRMIVLGWGANSEDLRKFVYSRGLSAQIIILRPVGKIRLIEYYRSCDAVLDQLVFGYFGATALEAASIGKPIIMHLRQKQYRAFYNDPPPIINADNLQILKEALLYLPSSHSDLEEKGRVLREWTVKNHGEARTIPILNALLYAAKSEAKLPEELKNPLASPLSKEEEDYHASKYVTSF